MGYLKMSSDVKQVIVMRRDLGMRKGKMIAQGSHSAMVWMAQLIREHSDPYNHPSTIQLTKAQSEWIHGNFAKICVKVEGERELMEIARAATKAGLDVHVITDAGLTEFNGVPTKTCLCIGPDYAEKIDPITGNLELY